MQRERALTSDGIKNVKAVLKFKQNQQVEKIKQEKSQLKANTTIDIISSNVFHNQSQIDNKIVLERKCGCLPSTTSTTTTTTSTTTATISTTTTPTPSVFTMTLFLWQMPFFF